LKRGSCDASKGEKTASTGAAFISLPRVDPMPSHSEPNAVAHCEFPNGLTLTFLTGSLSAELLQQLYVLQPEVTQ